MNRKTSKAEQKAARDAKYRQCPHCPQSFMSRKQRHEHIQLVHRGVAKPEAKIRPVEELYTES